MKIDINKLIDSEKLVAWRRHFHMYPEIGFCEHEGAKYIAAELANYPEIEVFHPSGTSVVAVLKGDKPGKVLGLRADFDALPITEEADVEFKSKNPGVMHACGHDCHAAMLLGAVDALYKIKDQLPGTVKFIFQHAEELPPGGALGIIKSGILDDVQAFYGGHIQTDTPVGTVKGIDGPTYANTDSFGVTIQGKGTHAASPQTGTDPLLIGTEIVQALNFIVSRSIAPRDSAVVTVASFHAGTADNIIADTAEMRGTVRSYEPAVRDLIEQKIHSIAKGICDAYDATCTVDYKRGYSAVVNDAVLYELFKEIITDDLHGVNLAVAKPGMGGEDFSEYGTIAPAFFSGIGGAFLDKENFPHHHPKFAIDEASLPIGCGTYVAFALKWLAKN